MPAKIDTRSAKRRDLRKPGGIAATVVERATAGSGHLAKRADLAHTRAKQGAPQSILIIEDEAIDAERLTATLRVLFGYLAEIRWARSLSDAVVAINEQKPCVTFLDDILKPSGNASQTIPQLRHAGYKGPIIVVSGEVTHTRRSRLLTDGASDVIHKDDVDSVRVAEALARVRLAHTKKTCSP